MDTEISETEFLKQYDPNKYSRPSLAVDAIVFSYFANRLHVLLIRRRNHPYRGHWVFPGGFVEVYEDPNEAVRRELHEETGVEADVLAQLATFGRPDRDPRYHVVSVAYFGIAKGTGMVLQAGDDAAHAEWHPARETPPLGFDHAHVLKVALDRIEREMVYPSFALRFLGRRFTGSDLVDLYREVLRKDLDGQRFLRRFSRYCLDKPTMTRPVRVSRVKLRKAETAIGAWWM